MRWSRRTLLAVSLALCASATVAWPVSFYRTATVRRVEPQLVLAARVGSGRVALLCQTFPASLVHPAPARWSTSAAPVRDRFFRSNQRWRETVRFEMSTESWRTPNGGAIVARSFYVPLWFPALIAALAPAVAMQRWITRRRRAIRGQCVDCGYDLQQSPDRCPECGLPSRRTAIVHSLPLS